MSFTVGGKFLVGINLGWYENNYGYDLGYSEFSNSWLWIYPYNAPIMQNLSVPNKPAGQPYLLQHPEAVEQYFTKVGGVDIVRLWLFEQLEGLVFETDGSNNISKIDQQFINNLVTILDSANNHNIKVYLTLLNSWDTLESAPSGIDPSRLGKFQELLSARKQIILKIIQNPSDFCSKVVGPLLQAIQNKPAIFAIDIINEPDGMIDASLITPQQLKDFVEAVTQAIKPYGIKVSVGCLRKSTATALSSTSIDFSDIHGYNDPSTLNNIAQLDPYNLSDFSGKSCILGECGYDVKTNPYDPNQETSMLQSFLQKSNALGYAGALGWRYQDYQKYQNQDKVLQTVLNFANTKPTIQGKKNQGCFIATAAMGSELHPQVQFLREYRDNVLLKSSHKQQFEKVLDWYYKFSPPIAEAMNNDKNLKRAIKYMIIYPIVFSLKILVKLLGSQLKN